MVFYRQLEILFEPNSTWTHWPSQRAEPHRSPAQQLPAAPVLRVSAAPGAPRTSGHKLPRGRRETDAAVLTERQVLSVQTVSRLRTLSGPLATEGWRDHRPLLLDKLRQLPTPWTNRLGLEAARPRLLTRGQEAEAQFPETQHPSTPGVYFSKRLPRLLLFPHFPPAFSI